MIAEGAGGLTHVLITVTGAPRLLRAQLSAIRAFIPGRLNIVVVDDSRPYPHWSNGNRLGTSREIDRVVREFGGTRLRFPQIRHYRRGLIFPGSPSRLRPDAATRCADAIQFGIRSLEIATTDQLLILDADMVPFRQVELGEYFRQSAIWYVPQERRGPSGQIIYPWNGIFFAKGSRLVGERDFSWNCGVINGMNVDVGGEAWRWLARHTGDASAIAQVSSGSWRWDRLEIAMPDALHDFLEFDLASGGGSQIAEVYGTAFLHMRAGGNWNPAIRAVFARRRDLFTDAIEALIPQTLPNK